MFKRLWRDTSGNFSIMFGAVATILLLGAAVAIDYSSMVSKKSHYQSLADAATLAASGSGVTTLPELKQIAEDYVNGNNFSGEALNITVSSPGGKTVRVQVSGSHDTFLLNMFGTSKARVSAGAESPILLEEPVDIALVLDITGSMSGTKIDGLKTAANALIDELESFDSADVRVAVIPFRDYVNIGMSRRGEPWLDVDDDSSTTGAEVCYMRTPRTLVPGSCETYTTTCDNDGVAYSCTKTRNCEYTDGEPYEYCYTPTTSYTWRGCAGSRTTPWNERPYKGTVAIPGVMNIYCGQEIQELTSDMSLVRAKIDSLTAYGKTYLPSGLIWGWRAIHAEQPLTETSSIPKNEKTTVMIFMTDGANTRSQNGELHNGSDTANADFVTKQLCNGIAADGVDIYTVAYDFDAADTINMLRQCASLPSMFFRADDTAELINTFEQIGKDLFQLRLSQ